MTGSPRSGGLGAASGAGVKPWRLVRTRARPISKSWATTSALLRRPLSGATSMVLAPMTT